MVRGEAEGVDLGEGLAPVVLAIVDGEGDWIVHSKLRFLMNGFGIKAGLEGRLLEEEEEGMRSVAAAVMRELSLLDMRI